MTDSLPPLPPGFALRASGAAGGEAPPPPPGFQVRQPRDDRKVMAEGRERTAARLDEYGLGGAYRALAGLTEAVAPTPTDTRPQNSAYGGFVRGLRDIPDAGAQLVTRGIESASEAIAPGSDFARWAQGQRQQVEGINTESEREYQQDWRGGQAPSLDGGRIAGNVVGTIPLAAAAPGMAAAGLPARLAAGAGAGGTIAATTQQVDPQAENFWQEKLKQFGTGAAFGAGGTAAAHGLSRVLSPRSTPQVQHLMREGVTPTPGQALGGMARRMEEKLASIPFLGDVIRMGETRALNQFNAAAINRALGHAGLSLPKGVEPGRAAIAAAGDAISQGYDDALRGMSATLDKQFADDLANIANKAKGRLPETALKELQAQIDDIASLATMQGGRLTGREAKEVISKLGADAADLRRSGDPWVRRLGDVIGDLRNSFHSLLVRSSPAESAAKLRGLDTAYKEFLRLENAAARTGAEGGVFSPSQLLSSTRQMDRSLRKGAFARGNAPMQDLAEAGKTVLSNKVPNSGTLDRALVGVGALTGGAGLLSNPYVAAGIGAPALGYTPLGQRALAALLAGRQGPAWQALGSAARQTAPAAAATGGSLAALLSGL